MGIFGMVVMMGMAVIVVMIMVVMVVLHVQTAFAGAKGGAIAAIGHV